MSTSSGRVGPDPRARRAGAVAPVATTATRSSHRVRPGSGTEPAEDEAGGGPHRRDDQRAGVYAGEQVVHGLFDRAGTAPAVQIASSTVTLPVERRFGDVGAVQRYVDAVLTLDWVHREFPRSRVPVTVRARRGGRLAHYEREAAVIAVPVPVPGAGGSGAGWALRELVVLHEIAHHLAPDPDRSGGAGGAASGPAAVEPPHGPAFVGRLRRLVERIVGPEAGWLLTVAWADQGVRG